MNAPAPVAKNIRWPDLTAYGANCGIRTLRGPDGQMYILALGIAPDSEEGRRLQEPAVGFKLLRGTLVRQGIHLSAAVMRALPKATVRDTPVTEIALSGGPAKRDDTKELENQLRAAELLGLNHLGQEVYVGANGRFLKSDTGIFTEREGGSGALFLRAAGDGHAEVSLCADGFVERMHRGEIMRADDLRRFASVVFGTAERQMPIDDLRLRDAQEAVEAAMQRRIFKDHGVADRRAFDDAVRLLERQPTMGFRTSVSVLNQQFSTPLPMSIIVQRILGDTSGEKGLEPTIGNASLVMALPTGTQIDGFEIDPARAARAAMLRDGLTVEAGDFLRQKLDRDYDFVVANPPFGGLKKAVDMRGLNVTRIDHLIAMKALAHRKENGHAVFILAADHDNLFAQNAGEVSGGSKNLLNWLADHYVLEDVVEVSGGLYAKQGASYPVRIVTVGRQRSEEEAARAAKTKEFRITDRLPVLRSWEEAWQHAEALAERIGVQHIEESPVAIPHDERAQNDFQAPYVAASQIGEVTAMIPRNLVAPLQVAFERFSDEYGMSVDDFVCQRLGVRAEALAMVATPEQVDAVALGIRAMEQGRGLILGDQTGQGKGRTLALMALYATRRKMPVSFLTRNEQLFSDFYRDLADTGVAGRFGNVVVLNNGARIVNPYTMEKVWSSTPASELARMYAENASLRDAGADLMLATYSQFNRSANKSPKSAWLPDAVRGALVIMDESHLAAGEGNTAENIALAIEHSEACVYSSATFAKGAKNMGIYSKAFPEGESLTSLAETLQAGGEPLQEVISSMLAADGRFVRREHDLSRIQFDTVIDEKRRTFNREVSDQLADILSGMSHLSGDVEGIVTQLQKDIRKHLEAMSAEQRKGSRMGVSYTNFGSRLYTIMRQFHLSAAAEFVSEQVIAAFEAGRKPVIAVEQTNESLLMEALGLELDERAEDAYAESLAAELDGEVQAAERASKTAARVSNRAADGVRMPALGFKDILHRSLNRITEIVERNDYGSVTRTNAFEKAENKEQLEALQNTLAHLRAKIDELPDLPGSPLDLLRTRMEAAGMTVSEVSGRKYVCNYRPDGDMVVVPRADNRKQETFAFNNGDADAIIITTAGSTGISLHASERFADQRQRHLFELQIANNVADRLQFWGRVDRRGQVVPPRVTTCISGLPSQVRVLAMQNAKLRKLSANTSSNRDNAAEMEDIPDLLNSIGDEVARSYLIESPALARVIGFDMEDFEDGASAQESRFINRLLGRLILFPVETQDRILNDLQMQFSSVLLELDNKGINPLKSNEHDWKAKTIKEVVISGVEQDRYASEFDRPVVARTVEWHEVWDPLRSERVGEMIKQGTESILKLDGVKLFKPMTQWETEWMSTSGLSKQIKEHVFEIATVAKPKRFDTVEQALNDEKENICKLIVSRGKWLADHLDQFMPGSSIKLSAPDEGEGAVRTGVITGLHVPSEEHMHRPGEYTIKVVFPGRSSSEIVTLAQVMGDPLAKVMRANARFSPEYASWMEAVDAAPAGNVRFERTVLVGNLYAAAAMAAEGGLGASGVYTDESGVNQRGIILYGGVKLDGVTSQPVAIPNPEAAVMLAREVFEQGYDLSLHSCSGRGERSAGLAVTIGDAGIKLVAPGSKTVGGQWHANEALVKVTGSWAGSSQTMSVTVPLTRLDGVMSALYRCASTKLYADASMGPALGRILIEMREDQRRETRDRMAEIAAQMDSAEDETERMSA